MRSRLPPPGLAHRSLPSPSPFPSSLTALSSDDDDSPEGELQNWSSLIGIVTAICGNVLIALALNVQRYAHIRLHRKRARIRDGARQATRHAVAGSQGRGSGQYGAAISSSRGSNGTFNGALDRYVGARYSAEEDARDSSETEPLAQSFHSDGSAGGDGDGDYSNFDAPSKISTSYLKDPYWWLGQVLITIGEMGNFLAYGFAPASIVSPLGVVALVSNCVIAPIFFKEVFRQRDFWGVIIATTGAVTVVLSAETEETKLGPHDVWDAITTMEFEIYMAVSCALIVLLMCLSPRYGHKTILVDLGLVGLFGMPHPSREECVHVRQHWLTVPRRLHGLIHQGHLLDAVFDPVWRLRHARHLRPRVCPPVYRHHAGPLRQQGAPALRLHPGHPSPVRPIHPERHHWQRRPLSRL